MRFAEVLRKGTLSSLKVQRDVNDASGSERSYPVYSPAAEHSLLVECGDRIDHGIHGDILRLDKALAVDRFDGFLESVPVYAGILIRFDPLVSDPAAAEQAIRQWLQRASVEAATPGSCEALVCHHNDLAPDLGVVAKTTGLS